MSGKLIAVLSAGVLSCGLFMALHAFAWESIFDKRPKPPWTYVAGILGLAVIAVPFLILWGDWWALRLAIADVVGAGAAVIFGYKVRGQGPIVFGENPGRQEEINILRERVAELERKLMVFERGRRWLEEKSNHPKA